MTTRMAWIVPYEEMAKHLRARQKFHEDRAEYYGKKQAAAEQSLKQQIDEAEDTQDLMLTKTSNSYSGATNKRDQARNSARSHALKAVAFKWKAEHLIADSYELHTGEAVELEFFNDARY